MIKLSYIFFKTRKLCRWPCATHCITPRDLKWLVVPLLVYLVLRLKIVSLPITTYYRFHLQVASQPHPVFPFSFYFQLSSSLTWATTAASTSKYKSLPCSAHLPTSTPHCERDFSKTLAILICFTFWLNTRPLPPNAFTFFVCLFVFLRV